MSREDFDIDNILTGEDEDQSELNHEFGEAFDDTENFDFGFEEQRADEGLANFGFDADVAQAMREADLSELSDAEEYSEEDD
jgi:hypothetical protein